MTLSVRHCAIGVVTSAAMILASAAPALASTGHHAAAKRKPAATRSFKVHGVVLAVHGNKVKVLSSVAKVGKTTTRNKVVTLTLTPRTHKTSHARTRPASQHASLMAAEMTAPAAPVLAVGDDINAVGTVTSTGTLVTTSETSTVLPAEALVGPVTAVNPDGSFVIATHDQVDGDHAEHDSNPGTLVAANGLTPVGPAVAVGDYAVVLGEAKDHLMTAAKIYTFTAAPALAAGHVTAADATAKTLTVDAEGDEQDGQEQPDNEDGSNPSITVDASKAEIVVNGATPSQPVFPAIGDEVLIVGTAGATPNTITADLVFDFNPADNGSVEDNQNNENHGDNGDH